MSLEVPPPDEASIIPYLCWWGLSHTGKVRRNNEDSFLGLRFDAQEVQYLGKVGEASLEHNDYVFAVSDGMGGESAGEFASKIAVEKITRLLPRSYQRAATGLATDFHDVLPELYTQIHKALLFLGSSYEECRNMGTTLTLAWFTPAWMYFAHIGDSRLYYLSARDGVLRQLSQDDTYVGWLFRTGQINEREARTHPGRNSLQKALGSGHQFVDPQVGSVGLEPGDLFLLCSDGLTDGLFDYQIAELLRPPDGSPRSREIARTLVEESLERSGRDNTTAVIIEVQGSRV